MNNNIEHRKFSPNDNYLISSDGRVFSLHSNKYLKGFGQGGYQSVNIRSNDKRSLFLVHRMVAMEFLPKPDNCDIVNHKDGNKSNNHKNNLEWVTCFVAP